MLRSVFLSYLFFSLSVNAFAQEKVSKVETLKAEVQAFKEFEKIKPQFKGLKGKQQPSAKDIMSLGQLGGALYPTKPVAQPFSSEQHLNIKQANDDNFAKNISNYSLENESVSLNDQNKEFGAAMEEWNQHNYKKAFNLLDEYVANNPEGIWRGEAQLHMGCEARFNGRYREAGNHFTSLIDKYQDDEYIGARLLADKAKSRLAVLRIMENSDVEAEKIFADLSQNSPDWRLRTYAQGWIQRISRLRKDGRLLADCGTQALGQILVKDGNEAAAEKVRKIQPQSTAGFSLEKLTEIAGQFGYSAVAIKAKIDDLSTLPMPAIAQIDRQQVGGSGHYWIIENVNNDQVTVYDEQNKRRFTQTLEQFAQEWHGNLLVFDNGDLGDNVARVSSDEAAQIYGGCCGIQNPEDDLGDPDPCKGGSKGCPTWRVNQRNMNFYMTDTPLWYDIPQGLSIRLRLSYNSQSALSQNEIFGNKWTFNYGSYVVEDPGKTATVFMADGRRMVFVENSGVYEAPYGDSQKLVKVANNHYQLIYKNGSVYNYSIPANTQSQQVFLTKITDKKGIELNFEYDTSAKLTAVIDHYSRRTEFVYDNNGRVTQVNDPFGRNAQFGYDTNGNLTSITDMGGYVSTLKYDANVYVTEYTKPEHGTWKFKIEPSDTVNIGSIEYPAPDADMWANYRITITDPLGQKSEYHYSGLSGYTWYVKERDYVEYTSPTNNAGTNSPKTKVEFLRATGGKARISKRIYPDNSFKRYEYDVHGNKTAQIDEKGNKTQYTYNASRQKVSKIEAAGTPLARTTLYEYLTADTSLLTKETRPALADGTKLQLLNSYDANKRLTSATRQIIDSSNQVLSSRVTTYQYNSLGQLTSVDGPRTDVNDVTQFAYYNCSLGNQYCGQIHTVTNALGHVTQVAEYSAVGLPSKVIDANGVATRYVFDNLNRVVSIKQMADTAQELVTTYSYFGVKNQIKSVTFPTGQKLDYNYDSLGRLESIEDLALNKIEYSYDANGNLIQTQNKDSSGAVTFLNQQSYNLRNRLTQITKANGSNDKLVYDSVGNVVTNEDALQHKTNSVFDALNRQNNSKDPLNQQTQYQYDNQDRVTAVTDAKGLTTSYQYNAFGDLFTQTSPDTGVTQFTYDSAGNRASVTDARNITVSYQYDALNRKTSDSYPNTAENRTYSYDDTINGNLGIGRLTQINDASGIIKYQYTPRGQISSQSHSIDGFNFITQYSYDGAAAIASITYPNGDVVNYSRNTISNLILVDLVQSNTTTSLASSISYLPFGTITNLTYGNGKTLTHNYNQTGELTKLHVNGVADIDYRYTARSNISAANDVLNTNNAQTFQYDVLSRLSSATGSYGTQSYQFDAIGNRLRKKTDNEPFRFYQYGQTNHHLQTVSQNRSPVHIVNSSTDASSFTGQNGYKVVFRCTAPVQLSTTVWGTQIYTDDSSVCVAGVHSGIITATQGGDVMVEILPGQASYSGTQANGVTSSSYGTWHGSYKVSAVTEDLSSHPTLKVYPWDETAEVYRGQNNTEISYACPAPYRSASIWGTGIYADDSSVCVAATHSGLIDANEGGYVKATIKPGRSSYTGSTQNGVTSFTYGAYGGSYTLTPDPAQTLEYAAYSYDAMGNTLSNGELSFSYNQAGRLATATKTGISASYVYNAQQLRVKKTVNGVARYYVYDLSGQLIAEANAQGSIERTYVTANGQRLAMTVNNAIYYSHNDHLGTPMALTDQAGVIQWQANKDPYGAMTATINNVEQNLRFPGQYFDQETGLHYNWHRYYDPETGRYVTSDPIGLRGGLNTFGYVYQSPLNWIDPYGLAPPHDTSGLPPEYHPINIARNPPGMYSFRPNGPADVRSNNLDPVTQRSRDGSLSRQQLTDIGNYNFGVGGAANGYPKWPLEKTGDYDQWIGGKMENCPYRLCVPKDNPRDREMWERGYDDYKNGYFGEDMCRPEKE